MIRFAKEHETSILQQAVAKLPDQTMLGVSEYQLTHSLPDNLKSSLPSVEEIEAELASERVTL